MPTTTSCCHPPCQRAPLVLYPTARATRRLPRLQAAQSRAAPCHRAHCSQQPVGVQPMDPQLSRQLTAATHTQQACAVPHATTQRLRRLPRLQAAQSRAAPCHRAHCSQQPVGVQPMDPQLSRQLTAATHTQQACAVPHATTQRLRCWIAQHLRMQRALLRRRLSQPLVVVQPVDPQPRRQLAAAISSPPAAAAATI